MVEVGYIPRCRIVLQDYRFLQSDSRCDCLQEVTQSTLSARRGKKGVLGYKSSLHLSKDYPSVSTLFRNGTCSDITSSRFVKNVHVYHAILTLGTASILRGRRNRASGSELASREATVDNAHANLQRKLAKNSIILYTFAPS